MEKNKFIQIYRGKFHKILVPYLNKINKVFVFDLDETIGSFKEFIILLKGIKSCREYFEINEENNKQELIFCELLDLYPEFLRYGIVTIFEYLKYKKEMKDCSKIFIYTNNVFSPEFPLQIKKYFDYKLKTKDFFDQIINAFKVKNKIIEPKRTANTKNISDFFNCTLLPHNTEVCFIDNTYYSKMKNEKILYIQPKSYYHNLDKKNILQRFFASNFFKTYFLKEDMYSFLNNFYKNNMYNTGFIEELYPNDEETILINSENFIIQSYLSSDIKNDYKNFDFLNENNKIISSPNKNNKYLTKTEIDIYVSKKIMYYIREFFYVKYIQTRTRKNRNYILNFSKKNKTSYPKKPTTP